MVPSADADTMNSALGLKIKSAIKPSCPTRVCSGLSLHHWVIVVVGEEDGKDDGMHEDDGTNDGIDVNDGTDDGSPERDGIKETDGSGETDGFNDNALKGHLGMMSQCTRVKYEVMHHNLVDI